MPDVQRWINHELTWAGGLAPVRACNNQLRQRRGKAPCAAHPAIRSSSDGTLVHQARVYLQPTSRDSEGLTISSGSGVLKKPRNADNPESLLDLRRCRRALEGLLNYSRSRMPGRESPIQP